MRSALAALHHFQSGDTMGFRPTALLLCSAIVTSFAFPAAALDRRVKIVNRTGFTIVKFYGSNKGTDSWEEDILGRGMLPSGESVTINFDDRSGYCVYDFKAVFNDGDVLIRRGVNVCELGTFTYE